MTFFMIESITTLLGIERKSDKDILEFVYLRLIFIYVLIEDKISSENIFKVFSMFLIKICVIMFI